MNNSDPCSVDGKQYTCLFLFCFGFYFFFVILLFFLSHHGSTGVISWILILVIPPFHKKEDVESCVGIIDLCLLCSSNGKIVCGMIYVPYYCMLGKKSSFVFLHLAAHKGGNKPKVFTSPFATFEVQGSSYRKSLCILKKKKEKNFQESKASKKWGALKHLNILLGSHTLQALILRYRGIFEAAYWYGLNPPNVTISFFDWQIKEISEPKYHRLSHA